MRITSYLVQLARDLDTATTGPPLAAAEAQTRPSSPQLSDPRARGTVCSQLVNPMTIRLKSEARSPCPRDLSALGFQVQYLKNGSWLS